MQFSIYRGFSWYFWFLGFRSGVTFGFRGSQVTKRGVFIHYGDITHYSYYSLFQLKGFGSDRGYKVRFFKRSLVFGTKVAQARGYLPANFQLPRVNITIWGWGMAFERQSDFFRFLFYGWLVLHMFGPWGFRCLGSIFGSGGHFLYQVLSLRICSKSVFTIMVTSTNKPITRSKSFFILSFLVYSLLD